MTTGVNACSICVHLDPLGDPVGDLLAGRCAAFPDGIPEEIWSGDHAHQVPFSDEEILFEADEGEDVQEYLDLYEAMVGQPPEGVASGVDN